MCGFAGAWWSESKRPGSTGELKSIGLKMGDAIAHRGPDGFDAWVDERSPVVLSHRRLAILDLSPAGHQPMASDSGRFVFTYNGEIYNFADLKKELETGKPWRGHSDTEILLRGFEKWGVEETLKRAVGMYAFALWDRDRGELTLARDRLGEKPLYYEMTPGRLLFGSEIKSFRAIPGWEADLDPAAMELFFRHNYIPAPFSIFASVKKLLPGTYVTLTQSDLQSGREPEPRAYWDFDEMVARALEAGTLPENEALELVDQTLRRSVREKLVADVPVGLFLSGGIDSSLVTALAQQESSSPVRTFSIGFTEAAYDEAPFAKKVAAHLGTNHTEMYVTPEKAQALIPKIPAIYDEPFADSSQIPTTLLAQLTRQHVTVSLSGDAGDEVFGGYTRYLHLADLEKSQRIGPRWMRRAVSSMLTAVPERAWDLLGKPAGSRFSHLGRKIHKGARALKQDNLNDVYLELISHWKDAPLTQTSGAFNRSRLGALMGSGRKFPTTVQRLMHYDTLTYLPDDILVKVDRATMSVSLEARAPFLDHRVIEAAWRLPPSLRVADRKGKIALRKLLGRHVPTELFERPKMGFGVPIERWLAHELRDWAESLLNPEALRATGLLNPEPILSKWQDHVSGKANWGYFIWDILMFQAWHQEWKRSKPAQPGTARHIERQISAS